MQAVNAAGSGDYSDLLTTITSEDSKLYIINTVTILTSLSIVFFFHVYVLMSLSRDPMG